ncbi:MAG: sugar phosphate isomerase/epimerase [Planctomycetes bacterium]|nr:sugar phosphate isomerase/epimerase [Planctomycetota bacterium]
MKLSLFSVSYAGYWGQACLDVSAFIAKAAELGYEAVMLAGKRPHLSPLDSDADRLAAVKAALEAHRVECAVIAGYTDLGPARAAEVPHLEMQIAYVESLPRMAATLGASVVRVFTAYEVNGHSPHAIWANVVSTLREMSDRAADCDVTIAVQNHHDVAVHTDALLELLSDVDRPNCKAGFDAWSPALRGEDLYTAARKAAPYTAITTNADYVRLPRFRYRPELVNYERAEPDLVRAVRFGEGFIDYEAFFQGLMEGGFDGVANYEMCSPIRGGGAIENLDAYAAHYVRWMREHVLKASR